MVALLWFAGDHPEATSLWGCIRRGRFGEGYRDRRCLIYLASKELQTMRKRAWRNKQEFKARVQEWAHKLGANVAAIYVRPMRRKWASCSSAGNLNFSDELLSLD